MPLDSRGKHGHRRGPRRRLTRMCRIWLSVGPPSTRSTSSTANPVSRPGAAIMMHVHGFGLSGRYLLPTAERLADDFHTLVPDLPGFGRSGRSVDPLDVPDLAHAAARFLDDRQIESVTLVGNSMGCPVICEFAHAYPERLERAVLVSPAGGLHNQPLYRAVRQLARDGLREPTRLMPVAVPDYLRFGVPSTLKMFRALTQYPSLERLARPEGADARGDRRPGSADAGPGPDPGGGRPNRQPRAGRGDRGSGPRDQLQSPGRTRSHHSAVHGRQADRGRPELARPLASARNPPRSAPPAPNRPVVRENTTTAAEKNSCI